MFGKKSIAMAAVALVGLVGWNLSAQTPAAQRATANKAFAAGNYKDAYDTIRKLAIDPGDDPREVGKDLELGVKALQKLGRVDEADDFREAVIAAHSKNWWLLETAAKS